MLLLGFGLAYTVWGIRQAVRNKPHSHLHIHGDGESHEHEHNHHGDHTHVHEECKPKLAGMSVWVIFIIFVLGPCEVLIPQLMYPAAKGNWFAVISVVLAFGIATIVTMTAIVVAGYFGLKKLPSMERYIHLTAGIAITLCGVAIKVGM